MKELKLTIVGQFPDEIAEELQLDAVAAATSPDRTALEKEVLRSFTEEARKPYIEKAEKFDV